MHAISAVSSAFPRFNLRLAVAALFGAQADAGRRIREGYTADHVFLAAK